VPEEQVMLLGYSCGVWKSIALSPATRFWPGLEEQVGWVVVVLDVVVVVVVVCDVVVVDETVVVVCRVVVVEVEDVVVIVVVDVVLTGFAMTVMTTLVEGSPNHPEDPWIIFHWKLYVPGVLGVITVNENILNEPGAIESLAERFTLFNPQFMLSCGFWEPRR
jgi:hypothetical protein